MAVNNPFFSHGRFISPSLNRLRIVDLPGFPLVKPYRNQTGYSLLAKQALMQLIADNKAGLQCEAAVALHTFDIFFECEDMVVRDTAVAIAQEYGRRLGLVLLTLKRGDAENRMARPEWDDRHWALWAGVDTVYLGGGLVAGHLGPIAAQAAQDLLRAAGFTTYRIFRTVHAAQLPLAGLAQIAIGNTEAMLVADFGHSAVKRALAIYENGGLQTLKALPSLPVDSYDSQAGNLSATAVTAFADWIVDVLADSWHICTAKNRPLSATLAVCLACYLVNGQPPPSEMGYYGRLQLLGANVQKLLSARLSARLKQPLQLRLLHDATAAALTVPKIEGTVVLMLGTAVGNAFPVFNP